MNFDLTPDQKLLVETAASFVKKESPPARVRKLRDDPIGWSKPLWKRMGDMGWLGILFGEEVGGFGGTFVDAALLLEQFGTTLVPEPYVPSVILGGTAITRVGDAAQRERWLAPVVAGDATLALAWAEAAGRYDATRVGTRAERAGAGWRLRGRKELVLCGHAADAMVVTARTSGGEADREGISLFVIARGASGVGVRPVTTIDGHRAAIVTFDGAEIGGDALLGAEGGAAALLDELMDLGAAAACAEGAGLMRAALTMTLEYLRTREQFGVRIGSFQALQHRAVDMFVETELAKSTSILASIKVSDPDPFERASAISAAKVQLAIAGRFVTQQAIQLHGGIGVTDEHDIGLYFKRMHALNAMFGDEEFHLARFARLPSFTAGLG